MAESTLSKSIKKVTVCVCVCMCAPMHVHGRGQGGKEKRQEPFHTSAAKGEDLPQLHLYESLEAMEHFLGQEGSRILLRERGT